MIAAYAKALEAALATMVAAVKPLALLYASSKQEAPHVKAFTEAALPLVVAARLATHTDALAFVRRQAAAAGIEVPEHLLPAAPGGLTAGHLASILHRAQGADAALLQKAILRGLRAEALAPARELVEGLADVDPTEDALVFEGDSDVDYTTDLLEEHPEERQEALTRKHQEHTDVQPVPRRRWKFARVLTGSDDCAFCVMLASAGARYSSAKRAAGSAYHPGCDCIAVVVFIDRWDAKAQRDAAQMAALWKKAQAEVEGVSGTKNDALNRFRRYMRTNKPSIPHSVMDD